MGIQLEVRKDVLDEENKDSSDEAIRVALLADLQQIQDNEAQNIIAIFEIKVTKRMSKVSKKHFNNPTIFSFNLALHSVNSFAVKL